jgi:hypothetical protein
MDEFRSEVRAENDAVSKKKVSGVDSSYSASRGYGINEFL